MLRGLPVSVLVIAGCSAMLILQSPAAHYRRALAALDDNRFETASYDVLWLDRNPRFEAQASLLSGALLVAEGDPQKASHVLTVASRDPDTTIHAMVLLGECLYKSDQFQEAGEVWTKAIELEPDNVNAHRWLGVAYYDLHAVREALVHLRRVAELDPRDPRPYRLIGQLCEEFWQPALAIEGYHEALRRAPDAPENAAIHFDLARLYYGTNEFQAALEQLSQCAPDADVLALTAYCQHGLGLDDQAQASLAEALRLDPQVVRALALKGQLLLERGDAQAAADNLEAASRKAPKDRVILHHLAMACQRLGQSQKAQRLRQAVERLDRFDAQYEDLALKAVDDPRDAQTRYQLGVLAAELGSPALARSWFQSAVHLEPGNAQAQAALQALGRQLESDESPPLPYSQSLPPTRPAISDSLTPES